METLIATLLPMAIEKIVDLVKGYAKLDSSDERVVFAEKGGDSLEVLAKLIGDMRAGKPIDLSADMGTSMEQMFRDNGLGDLLEDGETAVANDGGDQGTVDTDGDSD